MGAGALEEPTGDTDAVRAAEWLAHIFELDITDILVGATITPTTWQAWHDGPCPPLRSCPTLWSCVHATVTLLGQLGDGLADWIRADLPTRGNAVITGNIDRLTTEALLEASRRGDYNDPLRDLRRDRLAVGFFSET